MAKQRKPAKTPALGGLASFVFLMLIVLAALWMARAGTDSLSVEREDWTPAAYYGALRIPLETVHDSRNLVRIKAFLAEVSISDEQLAEYRTIYEVARAMPRRTTPPPHRIVSLQLGSYPAISSSLGSVLGQPLTDEIRPFAELSRTEQLLLYSDWLGTGYLDEPAYQQLIARMNAADVARVSDSGELSHLWLIQDSRNLLAIHKSVNGDEDELRMRLANDWLPRFASPVARGLFEPWHEEWTAGHGYIEEIKDDTERSRLIETIISHQMSEELDSLNALQQTPYQVIRPTADEPTVPSGAYDFAKFFYFRIYGENPGDIIAEGISQVNDHQAWQRRWENRPAAKP